MRKMIAQRIGAKEDELDVFPVLCRQWRRPASIQQDGGTDWRFLREVVHVAYVNRAAERPQIAFWPGITGYESYYVDSVVERIAELRATFVPADTGHIFGPPKFEDGTWHLNAGSDVYDRLTVNLGGLIEALSYFDFVSRPAENEQATEASDE